MTEVILYIATSQDGFIADANGGVDWLPLPQTNHDLEVFGYNSLMNRIDTIVMGSKSFKQIMGFGDWAWTDKHTYVFSSQNILSPLPYITITKTKPVELVQKITDRKSGKDIWLLGGAELAKSFADDGLIDEIIITIVPQNLNKGIHLGTFLDDFTLVSEKDLPNNMKQKSYIRK